MTEQAADGVPVRFGVDGPIVGTVTSVAVVDGQIHVAGTIGGRDFEGVAGPCPPSVEPDWSAVDDAVRRPLPLPERWRADEWPPGGPAEVAGAKVEHPDWYDHPNGIMVIGGVGGTLRFAISVAHRMLAPLSAADLTQCTAFGELPTSGADDGRVWFAPDRATGAAPVFVLPRGRR